MKTLPVKTPVNFVWCFKTPDEGGFPIGNYDLELSYNTSKGTGIIPVYLSLDEQNIIKFTISPEMQNSIGEYTLCLTLNEKGTGHIFTRIHHRDVVRFEKSVDCKIEQSDIALLTVIYSDTGNAVNLSDIREAIKDLQEQIAAMGGGSGSGSGGSGSGSGGGGGTGMPDYDDDITELKGSILQLQNLMRELEESMRANGVSLQIYAGKVDEQGRTITSVINQLSENSTKISSLISQMDGLNMTITNAIVSLFQNENEDVTQAVGLWLDGKLQTIKLGYESIVNGTNSSLVSWVGQKINASAQTIQTSVINELTKDGGVVKQWIGTEINGLAQTITNQVINEDGDVMRYVRTVLNGAKNEIMSEVYDENGHSRIDQLSNSITAYVDKLFPDGKLAASYIVQAINGQTEESEVKIKADKINLEGDVIVNALNVSTGKIKAERIETTHLRAAYLSYDEETMESVTSYEGQINFRRKDGSSFMVAPAAGGGAGGYNMWLSTETMADANGNQNRLRMAGGLIIVDAYDIKSELHTTKVDGGAITTESLQAHKVTQTSDERLKNIHENAFISLDTMTDAPLFHYELKSMPDVHRIGTSAQYWQSKAAEFVSEDNESGLLMLNYMDLSLACVLSLAKEVKDLKAELSKLKGNE